MGSYAGNTVLPKESDYSLTATLCDILVIPPRMISPITVILGLAVSVPPENTGLMAVKIETTLKSERKD